MLILQNKGGVIMKGLRRFISTFLVTVMAVSLLSACEKPAENNFSDVERFLSEIM